MTYRKLFSGNAFYFLLAGIFTLLVYYWGLFVTIMEPDAAVYAVVSMEMHDSGRYQDIVLKGIDWLDKPHFQFWLTAFSYSLFGVNNIAYKLPSILVFLIGVGYTYQFGKRFYSNQVGVIASLLLVTSWHIILSNNDVRAEPILTGLTILSLYHFAVYLDGKKFLHLMAGCLGLACLLMTKGLFTILPVASGILLGMVAARKWKEIFHWQWLAVGLLTAVFTLPSLLAYYYQFDLHPEKQVFGRHGVSGIRFFLWDSQWGRFTNSGPIKGKGDPSFFFHTLLWVFAPWALLAFAALYTRIKTAWQKRNDGPESYTLYGFGVMFLIFTFSRFQLAHYLNPMLPFVALLTAWYIDRLRTRERAIRTFTTIQSVLTALLFLLAIVLFIIYRPSWSVDTILVGVIAMGTSLYILLSATNPLRKLIFPSAFAILFLNYALNRDFYPDLMKYQSESEVAFYCRENHIDTKGMITVDVNEKIADFYLHQVIPYVQTDTAKKADLAGRLAYTTEDGLQHIRDMGLPVQILHQFPDFRVTKLKWKFLDRDTRSSVLDQTYLLKIGKD